MPKPQDEEMPTTDAEWASYYKKNNALLEQEIREHKKYFDGYKAGVNQIVSLLLSMARYRG